MTKKGQAENFTFGLIILIVGMFLIALWSLGEAIGNLPLSTLGKWGLGLLPIIIEIIQAIIKGFK